MRNAPFEIDYCENTLEIKQKGFFHYEQEVIIPIPYDYQDQFANNLKEMLALRNQKIKNSGYRPNDYSTLKVKMFIEPEIEISIQEGAGNIGTTNDAFAIYYSKVMKIENIHEIVSLDYPKCIVILFTDLPFLINLTQRYFGKQDKNKRLNK